MPLGGKIDSGSFPLISLINSGLQLIGIGTLCALTWMVSNAFSRLEGVERTQVEARAATAEARAQNANQYANISKTLEAFPLATDQLARAVKEIQNLHETDKDFDRRVVSLERDRDIQRDRQERSEKQLRDLGAPVNLRDTRR